MQATLKKSFKKLLVSLFLVYILALTLSLAAVITFTYYHKRELARILTLSVRNSIVVRDIRQTVLGLKNSIESEFSAIGYFARGQTCVFALPSHNSINSLTKPLFWQRVLQLPISEDPYRLSIIGELRFLYSPYEYTPYVIVIWLATLLASIPLLRRGKRRIIREHEEALRNEKTETFGLLARQVAHDIRSPLASLVAVGHSAKGLDEENRINLRNAANKIRDIANSLLDKGKSENTLAEDLSTSNKIGAFARVSLSKEEKRTELISDLIEATISQKRLQYSERQTLQIETRLEKSYGLFVEVQPTEWSRLLSNLVNNAVEAMPDGGQVQVSAFEDDGEVIVEVRDNGQGISSDVLAKLGQQGFSQGKAGTESGSGLGVCHAMVTVASWSGKLHYTSEIGKGTCATIVLPKAEVPRWFAGPIQISGSSPTVVVLDDDPGIHSIWKNRFANIAPQAKLLHFYSSDEILRWFRENLGAMGQPLYLCDYELIGSKDNGLQVIEMLGIASESVLVTSRTEEAELRDRCEKQGLRLLPKRLSPFAPIELQTSL